MLEIGIYISVGLLFAVMVIWEMSGKEDNNVAAWMATAVLVVWPLFLVIYLLTLAVERVSTYKYKR